MQTDRKIKESVRLITGILSALLLFLGTISVQFDWLTEESIGAFGTLLGAVLALGFALYGIFKNHYTLTKKRKEQLEVLERNDLK